MLIYYKIARFFSHVFILQFILSIVSKFNKFSLKNIFKTGCVRQDRINK